MKKLLNKHAHNFFTLASKGKFLSALDFYDEEISPYISEQYYIDSLNAWFSTLINNFNILDVRIKKLISFDIDDNDIFAAPASIA